MTEPKPAADRDREFARAFLGMHFDLESNIGKGGIEILCRALERVRQEERSRCAEKVRAALRQSIVDGEPLAQAIERGDAP